MNRGVSLASDRRGRVPFAVVGVVLVVASLSLAPTLSTESAPDETAVERSLSQVSAASATAVRDGVATASRRAATSPVVEPADTPVGRALSDDRPFRDSLRLRVYLQVRANLERLSARSDGVTATASLPAVDSTGEYERAIGRVHVERAGDNDTAVRATVENVTLTARRDGEVLTRRTVDRTVVVPTPVLHVHDQIDTYETRVRNGLTKPGLSQRMTARLYPIAWARGYAQFGGAPIENVIANRHASLATNGALLGVQRSVFGRSDPEGRQALKEATAAVGITDMVAGSNSQLAKDILSQTSYRPASQNITTGAEAATGPGDPLHIGVNGTADAAYREVGLPGALNATARDAYTVEATVVTEREHRWGGRPDRPASPGPNWTVARDTTESTATIVGTVESEVDSPDGWHAFDRWGRTIEITHTRKVTWVNGNSNRVTRNKRTERFDVSLALVGNHRNDSLVPVRGIETVHDADGSPLGGENLADVEQTAKDRLLDRGRNPLAKEVALAEFEQETVRITGERPDSIHTWIARDLRGLRERVRDIAIRTDRGTVGTFQTNPAQRLQGKLQQRRAELVDAPETYDSVAQRARVAARVAFLDAVSRRLSGAAGNHSAVESDITDQLAAVPGGSLAGLRRALTARETRVPRTRPTPTGPAGPVRTQVDAQPQYLTLASVSESRVPAVDGTEHPLVARNVNVFSIPYGNAATEVLTAGTGSRNRVGLATAAKTLAAAEDTEAGSNTTVRQRRQRLRTEVARANDAVVAALVERVRTGTDAGKRESERIVEDAMDRWETTASRGLALANESAATRVAEVAGSRRGLSTLKQDWLRLRLLRTTTKALSTTGARPPKGLVNRTANIVRDRSRSRVQSALADRTREEVERVAKKKLGAQVLPAGLPLAPPYLPWYLTLNIWWVTVEGTYARFSVTANHGPPGAPGAAVRYVREDRAVQLDVDGDGNSERLGQNTRISFRADTGVVVAVPPKPRGVGDKDGNSVETSAGWPEPG
ncbi:hypothetical protein EGH22_07170 [Halomicroarcula sp. F28]|uniref:DUF7286 family protein n=1 Tax=Haloarcula salinisoli TaxID=2487746 RepID=UPI001C72B146|nr:hypothetical protein [Halomicroarcula salinisoli]MBX0286102.1 hypothetical protein [Halomicroarcula salinisoli]